MLTKCYDTQNVSRGKNQRPISVPNNYYFHGTRNEGAVNRNILCNQRCVSLVALAKQLSYCNKTQSGLVFAVLPAEDPPPLACVTKR